MIDVEDLKSETLKKMLALTPEERVSVISALRYNDFFCGACGYGSVESPNTNCQCDNDE